MSDDVRIEALTAVAHGVGRPEDVQVARDGRVFVSDSRAALSEILPDGSLRRVGAAGGEPNGFALLDDDSAVIANFALGILQRLDLRSGVIETHLDQIDGAPLGAVNYVLADATGHLWVSSSARGDHLLALATGEPDGFIARVDPAGRAELVVEHIAWPNCMTFDPAGEHLYVCRSAHGDVVRFPRTAIGLAAPERYGPTLGGREDHEFGLGRLEAFGQPDTMRRWAFTDGCAFDAAGNLWVTLLSANRVVMITPELDVRTIVDDPDGTLISSPTSIAFGGDDGRDVYIGSIATDYVVRGRTSVPCRQNVEGRTSASMPPSTTRKLPTT